MGKGILTAIVGFIILFFFYHAAEYMILFQNSAAGFLGFQLLFFVAAWLIAKWQSGQGLAAWGLDIRRYFLKHLLTGMVMGVLLYGTTFMVSVWLGLEKVNGVPTFVTLAGPLGLFIFGNFFSSVSEDILTRGYVYKHLYGRLSKGWIVFLSATVYLLNHIYRLGDSVETHLYLFLLGVLFIIPLLLTKRLWFTSGVHWAGNVTFYFTHEMLKVEEINKGLSPNYVFVGVILLFIPATYYLSKRLQPVKIANGA